MKLWHESVKFLSSIIPVFVSSWFPAFLRVLVSGIRIREFWNY